jgi:tetratricopeptide (TPR) repeat protein
MNEVPKEILDKLNQFDQAYVFPKIKTGLQAQSRFESGRYQLSIGNLDEAEREFTAAIEFDNSDVQYWLWLCNVWYLRQDYEKCLELLQETTDRFPDEAIVYFRMGEVYQLLEQHRQACISFHKALGCGTYDDTWPVELRLGHSYRAIGNLGKALEFLRSAFRGNPESPETILSLTYVLRDQADALRSEGKITKARTVFDRALKLIRNAIKRIPDSMELKAAEAELSAQLNSVEEPSQ